MKVVFYRSTKNSDNELFKSPLMSIIIPNGTPEDYAIKDAIIKFENEMKISNWQDVAEFYEVIKS